MVLIRDEQGEFDAPLDQIWAMFQSKEYHRHASMANFVLTPTSEPNVVYLDWEAEARGSAAKMRARMTLFPPLGFVMEYVEGPLTGSKEFEYYLPRGDRTGIVVVGDYRSPVLKDDVLRALVPQALDTAFEEDVENLRRMRLPTGTARPAALPA